MRQVLKELGPRSPREHTTSIEEFASVLTVSEGDQNKRMPEEDLFLC